MEEKWGRCLEETVSLDLCRVENDCVLLVQLQFSQHPPVEGECVRTSENLHTQCLVLESLLLWLSLSGLRSEQPV